MDKAQAIHKFWSSFGIPAYDSATVPTGSDAPMFPYITYDVQTDSMDNVLPMSGSIWYRSTSWEQITHKTEDVARTIGSRGYYIDTLDNGYVWITKGTPFAQRMSDPDDDMIRRMYINISVEFLTAY